MALVERDDHGWDVVVTRNGGQRTLAGFSSAHPAGPLLLTTLRTLQARYGPTPR